MKPRRTLLIADDSDADREIIKFWVAKDTEIEYQFLEAASSQEALKLCQVAKIDCILLDLELPDLSGIEMMAHLIGRTGKLIWPVVMLTGYGNEHHAVQAMKLGAMDFLTKSKAEAKTLSRTINQAVERKASENRKEQERIELQQKVRTLLAERNELLSELEEKKRETSRLAQHMLETAEAQVSSAGY
jgi:FixJ family two-component response regulator